MDDRGQCEAFMIFFFSAKGQTINILGLVGPQVSVETIQLCHNNMKVATDNM